MSIHVPSCTKDVPAQPVDWEMMVDVAPWIQPGLIELAGSLGFDRACRALRSFAISLLDVLLSSDYLRSACLSLSLLCQSHSGNKRKALGVGSPGLGASLPEKGNKHHKWTLILNRS